MKGVFSFIGIACVVLAAGCAQEQPASGAGKSAAGQAAKGSMSAAASQMESVTPVLLDDFEGELSGGLDGTVDYGSGNGAQVEVRASTGIKQSGAQSLEVVYDAVHDGYMWIARGFELDASRTGWLVKHSEIDWERYNAFSFYVYGEGKGTQLAFDLKDGGDEMWRFLFKDDTAGWKQVICPFSEFFARGDWQPDAADKNAQLDFPVKSFQFEPRPQAQGTIYFDKVELIRK